MAGKAARSGKSKARGRQAGAKAKKPQSRGFKTFIFRVLKKLDGKNTMSIGKKTMSILNSVLLDLFDRVASEAGSICTHSKRHTLGAREVQAAVQLLFPGELCQNAVAEGTAAAARYGTR